MQVEGLRTTIAKLRDDYALDLIKIFNWDETDIGIDKDIFCTYVPSCQKEISVTVSDFLSPPSILPHQPSQFISMGSVNKVIGLSQNRSCTKALCEQVKQLIWSGRELCDFSITCRSFSPEGCSRFGIEVHSTAANGSHEICFKNQVVNMALHPQDSVDLRIWSDPATMPNVSCQAWCGKLNELPAKTAAFTSDAVRKDLYNAALNVEDDTNPKFG